MNTTVINKYILLYNSIYSMFGWFGTRVTREKVSDGGGRFIPAGIVGFHTLYLLLASLVAHDRATEDNHTPHTGRVSYTNTKTVHDYSWVQCMRLDREVLTPSLCQQRIDTDVNSHADETVMESYVNTVHVAMWHQALYFLQNLVIPLLLFANKERSST